jgi:AGCS family alanine or glycine:cation symporter
LATAIAAQVGTGNIAGAATAIVSGGPGAIFWMWLSAFFGMATIFSEATLAQKFKTTKEGQVVGGPAYYIRAAYKGTFGKILAGIFACLIIVALGFMGIMVQSNSIAQAFVSKPMNFNPLIVGVVVAVLGFLIFRGGMGSIASVVEKLVPVMAVFYFILCGIIIIANLGHLPHVIYEIFVGAFDPKAIVGGGLGIGVREAVRYGVARGLFSNEAGMGSTPHAHAVAKVDHPCDQGLVAMVGVFIDTFVVLNLTVFVILLTGVYNMGQTVTPGLTGIALSQAGISALYGVNVGNIALAICLFFFAFSTVVGWYFFGELNIRYLFGKKGVMPYAILVCIFSVIGSALKVNVVWDLADFFNSLMVLPNLAGLLALSSVVVLLKREQDKKFEGTIYEKKKQVK